MTTSPRRAPRPAFADGPWRQLTIAGKSLRDPPPLALVGCRMAHSAIARVRIQPAPSRKPVAGSLSPKMAGRALAARLVHHFTMAMVGDVGGFLLIPVGALLLALCFRRPARLHRAGPDT